MNEPVKTTLCYLHKYINNELCYLLIHKTRNDDPNKDKYLGIGGHFLQGEKSEECVLREIKEETGIVEEEILHLEHRGIVHFHSNIYGDEDMYLYTGEYIGEDIVTSRKCNEGNLIWYSVERICELPIWEGDKVMFERMKDLSKPINLDLTYKGDKLVRVIG
ncbi:MAG: NUDIX domain-containing protein [Clostridia bacterium]|nr:NUDIX domain-containing protein [Clostridia bacterium]